MENKNEFKYNYSSTNQEEIRKIKEKYTEHKELTNAEKIKALDASTTKRGTKISIIMGTISSLILGTGMSMLMLGSITILGLIIGIIGLIGMIASYPLYTYLVKQDEEKIRNEILELCNKEIVE